MTQINRFVLVMLCLLVACATPTPPPSTNGPLAQIAACNGRCVGSQVNAPHVLAATSTSPVLPIAWTVPAWFIDPANSITCASDTNSGTSATCTGGCSGSSCPSGIGPLLTYQELNVHRWGCLGNPIACPRLRQTTTITFLSSQSNDSDPVIFLPTIENSAIITMQGTPITVTAGVSLSGTVAFNRTSGQLQNENLGATAAVDQLVTNTSGPGGRAWVYKNVSGNTYAINVPLAQSSSPWGSQTPAETTWANTNLVTLSTLTKINIVRVSATVNTFNTTSFTPWVTLYQLDFYDPSAPADFGFTPVDI